MNIADVPFAILRLQYRAARLPLQLLDERVVARLAPESPARLFYERSFGALDVTVGNLLDDPEVAKRGAALAERSDALRLAAELEAQAGAEVRTADQDFKGQREAAARQRENATATKKQTVEESREQAQQRKQAAAQKATERASAAKERAEKTAAQRTGAVENAKRVEEAQISAAEKAANKAAQAKLQDAQEKRAEAAGTRAEADRVEELADAEKAKRQQAKAADSSDYGAAT